MITVTIGSTATSAGSHCSPVSRSFLGCVLTVPAEAALVLECNGFTEADAQTLGYVTWRGTAADESFTDVTGAWVWASGGRLSAQADASTYFCS